MSTVHNVPDVESAGPTDGAASHPLVSELVEAAEALAKRWITNSRTRISEGSAPIEYCSVCLRGSVRGVLDHAAGCQVGDAVRAAAAVRASWTANAGDELVEAAVRRAIAENRCPLCDWPLRAKQDGCTESYCSFCPRAESDLDRRWHQRIAAVARINARKAWGAADADERDRVGGAAAVLGAHTYGAQFFRSVVREHDAATRDELEPCLAKPTGFCPYCHQTDDACYAAGPCSGIAVSREDAAVSPDWSMRREGSAAVLRAQAQATTERRRVCGAHWTFGGPQPIPVTCDKEIGHDVDPLSDHWNRDARMSWPTAALIAEMRRTQAVAR